MIVVYAGRRPSDDEKGVPAENLSYVRERLDSLMAGLRPRLVVGSAAAGSDLIAVRAALSAGSGAHVVLAGPAPGFRSVSVVDRGDDWAVAFDRLVLDPRVLVTEEPVAADDDGFATVNAIILRAAERERGPGEQLLAVVVTAGRDPDRPGADHTEDLADAAIAAGLPVLRIDPTQRRG